MVYFLSFLRSALRATAPATTREHSEYHKTEVWPMKSRGCGKLVGALRRCSVPLFFEALLFMLRQFAYPFLRKVKSVLNEGLDIGVAFEELQRQHFANFTLLIALYSIPNVAMALVSILWGFSIVPTRKQPVPEWILALLGLQNIALAFRMCLLTPYAALEPRTNLPAGMDNWNFIAVMSGLCT
jgi:hypothetical protein